MLVIVKNNLLEFNKINRYREIKNKAYHDRFQ